MTIRSNRAERVAAYLWADEYRRTKGVPPPRPWTYLRPDIRAIYLAKAHEIIRIIRMEQGQ